MPNEEDEWFNRLVAEVKKWLKEKQGRPELSTAVTEATQETDFQGHSPPTLPDPLPTFEPASNATITNNTVGKFDVLCKRGAPYYKLDGNIRYVRFLRQYEVAYSCGNISERQQLVKHVYQQFRNQGGRFLKKDEATGELREITHNDAIVKIRLALYDRSLLISPPLEKVPNAASLMYFPTTPTVPPSAHSISNATTSNSSYRVNKFDVVCAKRRSNSERKLAGFVRYNQLVHDFADAYSCGTLSQKREYVLHVLHSVRGRGGRFLKVDRSTGELQELDDEEAFDKIRKALLYRSHKASLEAVLSE